MFEYIIIILVVGAAVYFTAKQLANQVKGHGCEGCSCSKISKIFEESSKTNQPRTKNNI